MRTLAAANTPEHPRLDRPISVIAPRSLREQDAAAYCGFSGSYLRNLRVADMRRLERGEDIQGPRWTHFGTAVRYMREDLDDWIDSHRTDPAQADPRETGL
jgi:hypothetical protein